jgi:hypothetical protein
MKKTNFQNEEIKRTGDKILSAIRLSDAEIDEIVGAPELFSRILETAARNERSDRKTDAINRRPQFRGSRLRLSIACCAVLLILTAGFLLLPDFKPNPIEIGMSGETPFPSFTEISENVNNGEKVEPSNLESPESPVASDAKPTKIKETGRHRNRVISLLKKTPAVRRVKSEKPEKADNMDDFQFLTFDPDATREGGRIVRVELPRASLYAMGVNIPPENGKRMIQADLFIGSDGTTNAIRIARTN